MAQALRHIIVRGRRLLLFAAGVAATSTAAAAAPTPAGADTITSSNWGGYAVHRSGVRFRRVTGTWTVGRGICIAGREGYAAAWIGLGGFDSNSQALEQIGNELDCSVSGRAYYSAWYELVPQTARTIRMSVRPGDTVTAHVDVVGTRVTLALRNLRSGVGFTRTTRMSSPDVASAEWIVEARRPATAPATASSSP